MDTISLQQSKSLLHAIGFIYLSYAPKYWYFEIVELARRLYFASVLQFIVPNATSQLIVGVVSSMLVYGIYNRLAPYDSPAENNLANTENLQMLFTFLLVWVCQQRMLGPSPKGYFIVDKILLAVNLVIIVQATILAINEYFELSNAHKSTSKRGGASGTNTAVTAVDVPTFSSKLRSTPLQPAEVSLTSAAVTAAGLCPPHQHQQQAREVILTLVAAFKSADVTGLSQALLMNADSATVQAFMRLTHEVLMKRQIRSLPNMSLYLCTSEFMVPEPVAAVEINYNNNDNEHTSMMVIYKEAFRFIDLHYYRTYPNTRGRLMSTKKKKYVVTAAHVDAFLTLMDYAPVSDASSSSIASEVIERALCDLHGATATISNCSNMFLLSESEDEDSSHGQGWTVGYNLSMSDSMSDSDGLPSHSNHEHSQDNDANITL